MTVVAEQKTLRYVIVDPFQRLGASVTIIHRLDMVLPRDTTLLRHRAERYQPGDLFDIAEGLDLRFAEAEKDRSLMWADERLREEVEMLLRNADHISEANERLAKAICMRD